eukprot:jgi/Astpho2/4616/Aster-00190
MPQDSGESSEDELESEQQTSDAESGSVQADSEQQSGEAASDSNAEADEAGPSHGNAEPQQQRSTPGGHGQKRKQAGNSASNKRAKISITLGKGGGAQGYLVCHVCGKPGHNAGFQGSVYVDCLNKPCFLCRGTGHTTMTCPHRIRQDHNFAASSGGKETLLSTLLERESNGRVQEVPVQSGVRWQVDAAVLRLHARRVTTLEFHPTLDHIVLSGDKKGQVAVWDHAKVCERTVFNMHMALTNNIRFLPGSDGMQACSASTDGKLKARGHCLHQSMFDIETGADTELLNLNPEGVSNEKNWGMLWGLDVDKVRNLACVGDSRGFVHLCDTRSPRLIGQHQLHKKGNKITSVHVNPADCNLLLTASNDWEVKLCDLRMLHSISNAAAGPKMKHPRLVNAAYFSPSTGRKIATTATDNRIRVWDSIYSLDRAPDREVVHSHDWNRYITPFRAEWDPKDEQERLMVIGRYISEDFGGVALHPVDLIDVGSGRAAAQLTDPNVATICTVNKCHPRLDIIITGSSRSLYAWKPAPDGERPFQWEVRDFVL